MENEVWYLDNFDFHRILCPYKLEDHVKNKPNKVLKKNEFLFMEREPCQDIILIDKGKIKVGRYDREGNETVITFLGKGEILGQMALIGQDEHQTFAQVMENGTQICKMSISKAKELSRDYVPFALEMNRRIGNHVRKLERRIELLTCKNVKTRMLEFLYDLGKDYGRPRDGGIWISHNLTQSDIGDLLGTSRKSASLCLNSLEEDGVIRFNRQHIFLVSLEELTRLITDQKKLGVY